MKRQNATKCGVPGGIKFTETGRKMELSGTRVGGMGSPCQTGMQLRFGGWAGLGNERRGLHHIMDALDIHSTNRSGSELYM